MAELIDRAAAIEWFEGYLRNDPDEHISPNMIISDLKSFPAVDAAPVVRCEDCKRNNKNGGDCNRTLTITERDYVLGLNVAKYITLNFCSYGEREDNMNFGDAIHAMKMGKKVTRNSWNGRGQYVFLADDIEFHTDADISEFYGSADGVCVLPMFVLRTAQGNLQPGWLATQSDMMANDWHIVE